jgi:hypothetical protein
MLLPEKERNMIKMLGNNWDQLPHAVQVGADAQRCSSTELGLVEKSLQQLPSDKDLGGIRVGSLALELPLPSWPKVREQEPTTTEL